ncbi:glucosyltransferase [Roseibacterium elongatum DSM 19469]|uniref:Glucosyltransferase n=1 Tax=Roseicyclus elongatus DSM 19469 TaxID=1294273 RepID=W8S5E0_9RHOB|nr:glycosyltransferase family 2 protein [Roseibacterium elongatum]AHM05432.1 glucosyltransferase [Roseibacterium elongatum DSM 19469]
MPKATIVVPAFNVTRTLPETLRSLRAQTERDLEIVIVDDGSHDETPAIAAQAMARDARIRVLRQANRGLAGARNTGIAAARGAYIGFCDADDIWEPQKLAAHIRHLDANPRVGLSFSGSLLVDDDNRALGLVQAPRLMGITAAHVFKRNPIGNGSAAVMRREAADAIAYRPSHETERDWVFDETFAQSEDIECWLRLALTTDWHIEGVPGALLRYRVNGAGLSAATDRQLASWEDMVRKLTPIAPDFFADHAPTARAYQLRYLARRAVASGDGPRAWALIVEALKSSRRPITEEPAKTLTTLAAACVMRSAAGSNLMRRAARMLRPSHGA